MGAADHPANRHRVRAFIGVPDTWDGWAIRVLTVMLAIVLLAIYILLGQIAQINEVVGVSRQERIVYQEEQRLRSCLILAELGVPNFRLEALQC